MSETNRNNEILFNRIESEKYKDIDNRIAEYDLIIDQRDTAKKEIDNLKVEVRNKLDKIAKLGDLQYDPGCSYCMNNVFVKDAIKTKEELEEDKTRAASTVAKLKTLENKIQINEDVPKSYSEFLDLKNSICYFP